MKTQINCSLVLLLLILEISPVCSYAQFKLEASLRPRAEYRNGYKELATNDKVPIFIMSQRTRLGLNYNSDKMKAKISFQDVRVWGDESQFSITGVHGDAASTDLAEAWLSLNLHQSFSITMGRQAFSLDDERLLAKRNWNQNGVFYDALSLKYKIGKSEAQMGFSYNNTGDRNFMEPYNPLKIKNMGFIHVNRKINTQFSASFMTLFTSLTRTDSTLTIYTKGSSGLNLIYKSNGWSLSSSFYYQYGKDVYLGIVKNTSAYNFNIQGEFTSKYVKLKGGCSLLSGDRKTDQVQGNTHLFDLLYGARHKYYGHMDYFNNIRKSTLNGGLNDYYATLGFPLPENMEVFGTYHLFQFNQIPESLNQSQQGNSSFYLGTEFDFGFKADLWEMVDIQAGYSFILPSEQLMAIQKTENNTFSSWAWVMLTFSLESHSF